MLVNITLRTIDAAKVVLNVPRRVQNVTNSTFENTNP